MIAGIDLGDRYSYLCLLDAESGEVIEEGRIRTAPEAFGRRFGSQRAMRIAIETGTHSPWTSRLLEERAHEVLVANARKLKLIYAESRKTDRIDTEKLARLARLDPKLLAPIEHRGEESSQAHLTLIRSREQLWCAPGLGSSTTYGLCGQGVGLPPAQVLGAGLPQEGRGPDTGKALKPALDPILQTIAELTARIREYERKLAALAEELYPETKLLEQVQGVGPLTALAFVLIVGAPTRFANGRAVGAYAGLVPGKDHSPEIATPRGASPDTATSCSEGSWWDALTTSSEHSGKTPISGVTEKRSPKGAARTPGRGR